MSKTYTKTADYFNGDFLAKVFSLTKSLGMLDISLSRSKDMSELVINSSMNTTQEAQADRFVDNWDDADVFKLVTNPTNDDLINAIQTNFIETTDGKYKILSPINSYEFSNSEDMTLDDVIYFSCLSNVIDWSNPTYADCVDMVLDREYEVAHTIIKDFLKVIRDYSTDDTYYLLGKLSEVKSAMDDGLLKLAKYINSQLEVDEIYTQNLKNWVANQCDNYFSKFPYE